jgi:Flp pilus assembly pilin Flp
MRGGEEMLTRLRKGQSVLEYTLLLGAVIAVIVAVLLGTGGDDESSIKGKIKGAYEDAGSAIEEVTSEMTHGVFGMGGGD